MERDTYTIFKHAPIGFDSSGEVYDAKILTSSGQWIKVVAKMIGPQANKRVRFE